MNVKLHKNARTTPAVRRELRESNLSERELARRHGLSRDTVRKWKKRDDQEDASHRPHKLCTTLSPAQEAVAIELRRTLLLPLDDLLAVVHEFVNPNASRSGLDRCLRRHGLSSLVELRREREPEGASKPEGKTFKDYEPGFVHADIKYLPRMPDETQRRYLFVGIDRATRWVYLELLEDKGARNAAGFLDRLVARAPFKIVKVLTDNGKEFTDRFQRGGEKTPSGRHAFDRTCAKHGIEHRLIKPRHPQTNGMVERFNGRIGDVLATTHFDGRDSLEQTLKRYEWIYNHHVPQKALGHVSPIQAMKDWCKTHPHLFNRKVYNLAGPDSYAARIMPR